MRPVIRVRATAAWLPTPHRVRTAGRKPWEMGGAVLESKSGEHSDEGEAVDRWSGGLLLWGFIF